MIKIRLTILFLFSLLGMIETYAQKKDKNLAKANTEYASNEFAQAEANYRISSTQATLRSVANYNLGNAIYKQNQTAEAKTAYAKAVKESNQKPQKHKLYHNLGNVFMKEKNYTAAVEAYKNALRNNPSDDTSRYNLALAKQKLKENPPKEDKKKDDKKKEQEKKEQEKKDKENQDKKEQDQKNQDEKDKKEGNDKPENNGKPKETPGGINPNRVESLLDAVNNEEKKVQAKVNKNKTKGKPMQTDKDW